MESHPGASNQQEGKMKKVLVAAVLAAGVAALTTAAFGSSKSPSRAASAGVGLGGGRQVRLNTHDRPRGPIHGRSCGASGTSRCAGRSSSSSAGTSRRRTSTGRSRSCPATRSSAATRRSPSRWRSRSRPTPSCSESSARPAARRSWRRPVRTRAAGLGFVSGSATRTTLTDGHTDGNRRGYFFRTVPNDAAQGPAVANWMTKKLKWKRVYIIDDQETYSQGLADGVQKILKNRGVTTSSATRSARQTRTSRRRSRRSRATTRASTSRGSSPRRRRRSASS